MRDFVDVIEYIHIARHGIADLGDQGGRDLGDRDRENVVRLGG